MFAATTVTLPDWMDRLVLPVYPSMPAAGFVLLGVAGLVLAVAYFAPVSKFPALFTSLALTAYYPLAYLFYWFVFRFGDPNHPTKFEVFLREHLAVFEWIILGICGFFSLLFFAWTVWATVRKHRKVRAPKADRGANPFRESPVPQPAASPRPPAPRPTASPPVPMRKPQKKQPGTENPFDFT